MKWNHDADLVDWQVRSQARSNAGRYLARKHRDDVRDATVILVLAVAACTVLWIASTVLPWFAM